MAAVISEPVAASTDLGLAQRKLAALDALPRVAPEAAPIAACEGALVAPASRAPVNPSDVEAWRASAATRARVAFSVVGRDSGAIRAPELPAGEAPPRASDAPELAVYEDAELPSHVARVALAWRGDLSLLGAARALGDPNGALAALVAASDTRAHVRSVTAALSASGACLSLRADVDVDPSTSAGAARVAELVALATREARDGASDDASAIADANEAAQQAALVALASSREVPDESAPRVVVSVPASAAVARDALASAIDAGKRAFAARLVESRVRVERGQPASWVLVASPCGTAGETDGDAGASAAFALAAATAARARGIDAEPWTAADGAGVLASGKDARALADALGRVFSIDPVEGARAAQARLLDAARPGLAGLAEAIAPGRPASVLPTGTPPSLLRLSDAAIVARADALRRGPIRVAILAGDDAAHADAAVTAVDRWALREGARSCPAAAEGAAAKPGTYAVVTDDGTSEAYVAASVAQGDEPAATALADALDGSGGLLERALGDGLARAYGARVLGPRGARALVVHVDAPEGALDAAVAQVRALFDRIRQGAFGEADLARARKHAEDARAARMRDPRQRLVALFRGDPADAAPTLDRVRAAAATMLADDALVIVAARPRRTRGGAP